jgi:hypothetical protein
VPKPLVVTLPNHERGFHTVWRGARKKTEYHAGRTAARDTTTGPKFLALLWLGRHGRELVAAWGAYEVRVVVRVVLTALFRVHYAAPKIETAANCKVKMLDINPAMVAV